jgi:hypothetical protein
MLKSSKQKNRSSKSFMGMALGVENKQSYSLPQRATTLVPMLVIGTPATRGLLAIPECSLTNFSLTPLWTREPAELGREMNGVNGNGKKEKGTATATKTTTR